MKLEAMDEFFVRRLEGYDEHMLRDVTGCAEGYRRVAELIPEQAETLLDLGCGTGLELELIFKRFPSIAVTGVDLTREMLDRLREKYPTKRLELICESYFDCELGFERFDVCLSFESLHHYRKSDKLRLYERVYDALVPSGVYIECDYMVLSQEEEDFFFAENERLRLEQGIADGVYCHYDTPCTVDSQIELLRRAGFESVNMLWHEGNTTLIMARKAERQP